MTNDQAPASTPSRRSILMLAVLGALFVIIPFMFWRQTWFGRRLSDQEMARYLADRGHPRRIQHALSQMSGLMMSGDPKARAWYPRLIELAGHSSTKIRLNAAWVMGQDNSSEQFHQALLNLLKDPELMVRRNAALSLVRFRDASGRVELVNMLKPYNVRSPEEGKVLTQVQVGGKVGSDTLLALVKTDRGPENEVRSPYSGHIERILAREGSFVRRGDPLFDLSPDPDQVWEALRALLLIGQPEDIPEVQPYTRGVNGMTSEIKDQALLTAQAIRTRSEREAIR